MNVSRAYYQDGYKTAARNGGIPEDAYWIEMSPYYQCNLISRGMKINNYDILEDNKKSWFDGYLDQHLSVGGERAAKIVKEYRRIYPEQIWPETIYGQQYTLFFNQIDNDKYSGRGKRDYYWPAVWPKPSKAVTVKAGSFPEALRQTWLVIVQQDTSLLVEVTLAGALLPIREGDARRKLLYSYYNASLNADNAIQRLSDYRRQFSQYSASQITELTKRERERLITYKALERELFNFYINLYNECPPKHTEIFQVAYIEEVLRSMEPSAEKQEIQTILDEYFIFEKIDNITAYLLDGTLPNMESSEDCTLVLSWNLSNYFLYSAYGWSPHKDFHEKVEHAIHEAVNGNNEEINNLLGICEDKRPFAHYANALMDAGDFNI